MAHHHLRAHAAQPVGDLRVHEHVDRPVGVGGTPDRCGHGGDAGVRPGLGAERLVEVGGAGGDLDHDGRASSPAGRVVRRRCPAPPARPQPRPRSRARRPSPGRRPTRATDSRPRSHSGSATAACGGRLEPGDAQPVAARGEPHRRRRCAPAASSKPRSCQVSSADAGPRAVRGDGAHLVDVARADGARGRASGRWPRCPTAARPRPAAAGGASCSSACASRCLDRLDERGQRGRRLRRTRTRRLRRLSGARPPAGRPG